MQCHLLLACVDNGACVNEVGWLVGDHLVVHVADVRVSKPNIPKSKVKTSKTGCC